MKKTAERVRDEVARDQTRTLLVRTARRVLTQEDSEDAAHDAVVQALTHADRFRADAGVTTWLYRIAFNAALLKRRSAQRADLRMKRVEREAMAVPARVPSGREVEEIELRAELRAAVAQLPEAYRTVIERCVYNEENPDRVAADLGLTPSALRTRVTRARDRLRALLEGAVSPPLAA
jgi:RNA polymerase sigma-70 factor, ECF subfamily